MKNKICEECVHFDGRASCLHRHRGTWGGCEACSEYTERNKPTNGDRIRAMSDEELAKLFVYFKRRTTDDDVYGSILFKQIPFEGKQRAIEATIEELKKEVEDE